MELLKGRQDQKAQLLSSVPSFALHPGGLSWDVPIVPRGTAQRASLVLWPGYHLILGNWCAGSHAYKRMRGDVSFSFCPWLPWGETTSLSVETKVGMGPCDAFSLTGQVRSLPELRQQLLRETRTPAALPLWNMKVVGGFPAPSWGKGKQ